MFVFSFVWWNTLKIPNNVPNVFTWDSIISVMLYVIMLYSLCSPDGSCRCPTTVFCTHTLVPRKECLMGVFMTTVIRKRQRTAATSPKFTRHGHGDALHVCCRWGISKHLIKPYSFRHLDHDQLVFNYRLSRARCVVEIVFGSFHYHNSPTPRNSVLDNTGCSVSAQLPARTGHRHIHPPPLLY